MFVNDVVKEDKCINVVVYLENALIRAINCISENIIKRLTKDSFSCVKNLVCFILSQKLDEQDFGERKAINKRKQMILEGKVKNIYCCKRLHSTNKLLYIISHIFRNLQSFHCYVMCVGTIK